MNSRSKLLIRTEASQELGHGHVARCLALAKEAKRRGVTVRFDGRGEYSKRLLKELGCELYNPAQGPALADIQYVIRDFRYGSRVEEVADEVAAGCEVLLVDEEGPARTVATLVTDAAMTETRRARLSHSVATDYLYGLEYTTLDSRFAALRGAANPGSSEPPRLFVCFGGRDPLGLTPRFVESLQELGFRGPATVVADREMRTGRFDEVAGIVEGWSQDSVVSEHVEMVSALPTADLLVAKLGVMVFEAFCVGVGSLLIEPTEDHVEMNMQLAQAYSDWPTVDHGLAANADFRLAAEEACDLLADRQRLAALGARGSELIDGQGACRVINALLGAG